jgi:hypothetical protein
MMLLLLGIVKESSPKIRKYEFTIKKLNGNDFDILSDVSVQLRYVVRTKKSTCSQGTRQN